MWKDSGRWTRQSKSKHSVTELLSRAFIEYFDRIWWYYCRHPHRRCRQQFLSRTSIRYLYRVRCDGGQLWRENSPHIRAPLVGISESDTLINKDNVEIWSNWKKQNYQYLIKTCYRVKNYYLQCSINCIISGYFPINPATYFKHLITYGNGPKKNASQYNLGTTKRWTLAHFASIFVGPHHAGLIPSPFSFEFIIVMAITSTVTIFMPLWPIHLLAVGRYTC